jgi:hypothetical protein
MADKTIKIMVKYHSGNPENLRFLSDYVPAFLVLNARKYPTKEYVRFKAKGGKRHGKFVGAKYEYFVDFHENKLLEPALKMAGATGFEKSRGIGIRSAFIKEVKTDSPKTESRNSYAKATKGQW